MKILDRYILTTFLQTLATVFVIIFFILILQGIWMFIGDLAGKDLDLWLIGKFLMFYSPTIVPLVLPLSILLASIMTFGNFAENYEFAAIKSSGISLQRAMKSLIYFISILSIVAFFFANNVIPAAQFKFLNLRKDIVHTKPAMAISEGQFSDVVDYNIKVDKKSGEKGEKLEGVTIHKKAITGGSNVFIKAKSGLLVSDENSSSLQLILFDGNYYENIVPKKYEERSRVPFVKASFKKDIINIDLSKLSGEGDNGEVVNTTNMLNIKELNYTIDSLEQSFDKNRASFAENIYLRTGITALPKLEDSLSKNKKVVEDLLKVIPLKKRANALEIASSNVSSAKFSINGTTTEIEMQQKNLNNHWLVLYEKFVIAYACMLMFFIGAPLGAIIRKGGLGLPIVFAMLIFIIFHFINTFGKKLAQENGITPFLGAWMSSIILTPLAVLLTHRATNDIGLINMDAMLIPLNKLMAKLFRIKTKKE